MHSCIPAARDSNQEEDWEILLSYPAQIALGLKFCPGLIENTGKTQERHRRPWNAAGSHRALEACNPVAAPKSLLWKAFLRLGRALPPEVILSCVMWCHGTFSENHTSGSCLCYQHEPHSKHLQNKHRTHVKRKRCRKQGQNCWWCKKYPQSYPLGFV